MVSFSDTERELYQQQGYNQAIDDITNILEMDKETKTKIGAEYKFWTGNCPHLDFIKHIIEIMRELGYHKLPKDKPPLLSDEVLKNLPHCWTEPDTHLRENLIAQAQREVDIKFYS